MIAEKVKTADLVRVENRLETEQKNLEGLMRQSSQLQAELDQKRADFQLFIGERERIVRQGNEKFVQDQKVLELQREEFKVILAAHQAEKEKLEKDKADFVREKSRFEGRQKQVNDFVQAVRRAYSVLPE